MAALDRGVPFSRKLKLPKSYPQAAMAQSDNAGVQQGARGESNENASGAVTATAVSSAYRRYAPVYDWVFGAVLEHGRRVLGRMVNTENPGTLLEVGVGTGLLLERYPAQTKVTGVDISREMLDRAQTRASQMPERSIVLLRGNAETLDFPAESFDCVTLPYVMSVTPDPGRLLAEAMRVCKPGGAVCVVNHFSGSRAWWLLERLVQPLAARIGFRSDFGLQEQIFDRGYQAESIQSANLFGLSRLVVIRKA